MEMKSVFVLGGNTDQVPYIKELLRVGYKIHLSDNNPICPGRAFCHEFYEVGYDNLKMLEDIARKIVSNGEKCRAFSASAQYALKAAARIASIFEQSFPKHATIEMCLDKAKFYKAFSECSIPIPISYFVESPDQLARVYRKLNKEKKYYLKSDLGKSPNYIYRISPKNFDIKLVNWKKDRYLDKGYVLQEEFIGTHLRLNFHKKGFNIFDFFSGKPISVKDIKNYYVPQIVGPLRGFINRYELTDFVVKFDVIANLQGWVALDIGLDPPFRMKASYEDQGLDFVKGYVRHLLDGKDDYESSEIEYERAN